MLRLALRAKIGGSSWRGRFLGGPLMLGGAGGGKISR